ncbi:MAG: DUF4760 domain-containing protein [Thaumarchaeota archaeon]|nr:DUF4760 domain-containing protein [Nitrososphaerota archaeon]
MARTVARKPKLADAQVLLQLNELQQSERIFNGWYFAQQDFKAKDYKDFLEKYPRGSQGYNDFMAVGHFLEVAGVLLKYGLLSEDLFFETFWFEPIWKNFEPVIMSMRKEFGEPSLEENFENLYNWFVQWRKKQRKRSS